MDFRYQMSSRINLFNMSSIKNRKFNPTYLLLAISFMFVAVFVFLPFSEVVTAKFGGSISPLYNGKNVELHSSEKTFGKTNSEEFADTLFSQPHGNGLRSLSPATNAATNVVKWQINLPRGIGHGGITFSNNGEFLYFKSNGSSQGQVFKIRTSNGQIIWQTNTQNISFSSTSASGITIDENLGRLYTTGGNGTLPFNSSVVACFSITDGSIIWVKRVAELNASIGNIGDSIVLLNQDKTKLYFRTYTSPANIVAVDAANGNFVWLKNIGTSAFINPTFGPVWTDSTSNKDRIAYVNNSVSNSVGVIQDDGSSASLAWSRNIALGLNYHWWGNGVISENNQKLYITSFSDSDNPVFSTLNTSDGSTDWQIFRNTTNGMNQYQNPSIGADGTIYSPGRKNTAGGLTAINPNGTIKWQITPTGSQELTMWSAVTSNSVVYTGDGVTRKLYAIKDNGTAASVLWEFQLPFGDIGNTSPSVGQDGTLYIATNNTTGNTTLFAFEADIPRPDLQIPNATVPTSTNTDLPITITWNDLNNGNGVANAPWADKVFLSTDNQVGNDIELAAFPFETSLNPSQSANRIQSITIPRNVVVNDGQHYLIIKTDANNQVNEGTNEGNNTIIRPITVTRPPFPDLIVAPNSIQAPNTAFFDQTIQVQWTVRNIGNGSTNASQWQDFVYLSLDLIPNGLDDPLRLSLENITYLAAGESYVATADVKIPRGLVGNYNIIVWTDESQRVVESNELNNWNVARPIQINAPLLPDLQTTLVQAPESTFAGGTIPLTYRVENQGTGGTLPLESNWADYVYLSTDTTLNTTGANADRQIAIIPHSGIVPIGQGYNATQTINIPSDIAGNHYVFVVADGGSSVYEFTNENNNANYDRVQPGSPMSIGATPPDLIVPAINAPTAGQSARQINVSWTVQNQGAFDAPNSWFDTVYLSDDNTPSPETDTALGTVLRNGALAAGLSYNASANVNLPSCISGNKFVYVYSDSRKQIFEYDSNYNAEANNFSTLKPIQITNIPSDLRVTLITNNSSINAGQPTPISWTVANQGTGETLETSWVDRVYLSQTAILNTQTATVIGAYSHEGVLNSGANYSRTENIVIPNTAQGTYYVIVTTDASENVEECSNNGDNTATSQISMTVANTLPDLQVSNAALVQNFIAGQNVGIQWTVTNSGQVAANNVNWSDAVYFSTDNVLDGNDRLLNSKIVSGPLAVGGSYNQQTQVTLPIIAPGNYFLIVRTDENNSVFEGLAENNNTNSVAIPFDVPPADLQVTAINIPTNGYSGVTMPVSWTVQNTGTNETIGSAWTDAIVISLDQILDPTDRVIGYKTHNGSLTAGASYNQTENVYIPTGYSGNYSIFVKTDRNNQIAEANENNNFNYAGILLELPPPSDLIVSSVTAPANASPGENVTFQWTIQNIGSNPALGLWTDAVYLSTDSTWDINDTLIGRETQIGQLGVGQTHNSTLTIPLPAINLGQYYVLVRTDVRNGVRETNEANNLGASTTQTNVDVTNLPLGTTINTTLNANQERYFKTNTPAGETVKFSVDGQDGTSNELFTLFGSMASRSNYDFQFSRPNEPDQETIVPSSQAGNYYNLARADYVPPLTPSNVTVKAEVLPFGLADATPSITGNSGFTTFTFGGAKFNQNAVVKLVSNSGIMLTPIFHNVKNHEIRAMFDMRQVELGNYSVELNDPINGLSRLNNAVTVVNASQPRVTINVIGPRSVRRGRTASFAIVLQNQGLNDAILSGMLVELPIGSRVSFDRGIYDKMRQNNPELEFPSEINSWEGVQTTYDDEIRGHTYLPLLVPLLRTQGSKTFNITVTPPSNLTKLPVKAMLMPSAQTILNNGQSPNFSIQTACPVDSKDCSKKALNKLIEKVREFVIDELLDKLPVDCGRAWLNWISNINLELIQTALKDGDSEGIMPYIYPFLTPPANLFAECGKDIIKKNFVGMLIKQLLKVRETFDDILDISEAAEILIKCLDVLGTSSSAGGGCDSGTGGGGNGGGGWGGGSGSANPDILPPDDPNEKIAPNGYGEQYYLNKSILVPYTINFENKSSALATASRVRVTDQLDPNLDWRTFRLKEIGFGKYRFAIPENRAFYQGRIQLGAELGNVFADVTAGIDIATGRVTWTLQAIDPTTGEPPNNANYGLLTPNNAANDGQGYVTYTVKPKITATTGTVIRNNATIIFDTEEPITTNTVSNTLDADLPTSAVNALPPTSPNNFTFSWTGSDANGGSGLQSYDIWVSANNGAYQPFLSGTTETSATFEGQPNTTYKFYSIARDNAGNVESAPTTHDAITVTSDGTNNPVPTLSSINPNSATAGGNAFTLNVNGTNFINSSVVYWNGQPRPTTLISPTKLNVVIVAADIANVGTANITVVNPTPGGGTSSALPFTITQPTNQADLRLTMVDTQDPVLRGQNIVYQITVTNLGSQTANNVVVQNEILSLGAISTITSSIGTCTITRGDLANCNLGNMLNQATATITVTIPTNESVGNRIRNYASVNSATPDPNTDNNSKLEETSVGASVSSYGSTGYRYLQLTSGATPPTNFGDITFNDSTWNIGQAAFGNGSMDCSPIAQINTNWLENTRLLIRKKIILPSTATNVRIAAGIDDDVEKVFFNGVQIGGPDLIGGCPVLDSVFYDVPQNLIQNGENVVAFQVFDRGGVSFFDMRVLSEQSIPTFAETVISGRVTASDGRIFKNATLTLTSTDGTVTKIHQTNPFGYYRFMNVPTGKIYLLSIESKHHTFTPNSIVLNVFDKLENVNFVANP